MSEQRAPESELPSWIVDRVRAEPPPDCSVVAGSTPVVCFGDQRSASVATLAINPSWRQFVADDGSLLSGRARRLAVLPELDGRHGPELDLIDVERVVRACHDYFDDRPYWRWFGLLEPVLQGLGVSYLDRSACHLDLVQWATRPVWSHLSPRTRDTLLAADAPYLQEQLRRDAIALVLVNGRSAVEQAGAVGVDWESAQPVRAAGKSSSFWVAEQWGAAFIGWSANLPHHACAGPLRTAVGARVAELADDVGATPWD